jgi:hydroxymethylglutaryl-CoA reductase (NADPH)
MRIILKPFTRKAVRYPIESIVFFFILTTLAYFHLLDAIKHSAFLAPSTLSTAQRPAFAVSGPDGWLGAPEGVWKHAREASDVKALELQQLIFSSDVAFENVTHVLTHDKTFQSACAPAGSDAECFVSASAPVLSLAFAPSGRRAFVDALKRKGRFFESGASFHIETRNGAQPESLAEMQSGMWIGYATRALVARFWDLGKVSIIIQQHRPL